MKKQFQINLFVFIALIFLAGIIGGATKDILFGGKTIVANTQQVEPPICHAGDVAPVKLLSHPINEICYVDENQYTKGVYVYGSYRYTVKWGRVSELELEVKR